MSSSMFKTVVALYFGSDLAHLEVLRVSHAADHVLRLLAEWVERLTLFQDGLQRFAIWMRFKLMNQLFLTASLRVSSCCWTVECGNPWILKSMLAQRVSPYSLPLRVSPYSLLRLVDGCTRFKVGSILASIMQIRLEYQFFAGTQETDTFCCTILLLTSCSPPSRCTPRVKCCKE